MKIENVTQFPVFHLLLLLIAELQVSGNAEPGVSQRVVIVTVLTLLVELRNVVTIHSRRWSLLPGGRVAVVVQ